ncbi:MAG: hypothetical protein QM730_29795 [Anaerolineales bacterium]
MYLRRTFMGILVVLMAFFMVHPVFAHGDEPRLEISVERVNPGGVIEVRGADFEMDELVTLELIGSDVSVPLGEFVADVEGVFSHIVTVPVDLKEGNYTFQATTDDHVIESPAFVVWGMAIIEDAEDGQRTDEDPLLAPMPTYAPGVSVTPMPVVEAMETPAAPETSPFPWIPVLAGVVIVGLFLAIFFRKKRA